MAVLRRAGWVLPIVLSGCTMWTTPLPMHQPYFTADPSDVKAYQALVKKQDALAMKCNENNSCDHVYFTRALLGLYESREVAEKYFGKVLAVAPKSRLGASSQAWLQLLQERNVQKEQSWAQAVFNAPALADTHASLSQVASRLVRDLLDKEIITQQLRVLKESDAQTVESLQREVAELERKIEVLTSKKEKDVPKPASEPVPVQSLQKQLQDRDKKIDELSAQLDALKRIDQEMREKVRPIRPPTGGIPVPNQESMPQ